LPDRTNVAHSDSARPNRSSRRDRNRRRRWYDRVNKAPISVGAKAWCIHIAQRSDDYAKPVYGMQTKQAQAIRCSPDPYSGTASNTSADLIQIRYAPIIRRARRHCAPRGDESLRVLRAARHS
jgi:hypothetical protein